MGSAGEGPATYTGNKALMLEEVDFRNGTTGTTGVIWPTRQSHRALARHRDIGLPMSEPRHLRHYTRLSRQNTPSTGLPLGSCTEA
jgi:glycine cleavage system protein P-like pyridoxal-binding family